MNGFVLRAAVPADVDSLVRVIFDSREQLMPFVPPVHTADENRWWVGHVLLPTHEVVVAEGRAVVGVVAFREENGAGWIDQLYVHPTAVHLGVGTALLVHALSRLTGPVRLYTFQENTVARAFYEKHGFRAIAFSDGRDNEEHCPDVLYEREETP